MKSTIVKHLDPEFEPVAVVWSDDTLTLTIPMPLFLRIEQEAENSVLQIPAWSKLRGED